MQPGLPASTSPISRIDCARARRCSGSGQWKTMNTKLIRNPPSRSLDSKFPKGTVSQKIPAIDEYDRGLPRILEAVGRHVTRSLRDGDNLRDGPLRVGPKARSCAH